jgi:hypothetical protein
MPIPLPNLDDRRYADLVDEARALIPTYAPEWTNHNPSDPGITLLEVFAYLTELLIYRADRVGDAHRAAFLRLLNGPNWQPRPGTALDEQIRQTILDLRQPYRAVTAEDYERLAVAAAPAQVARARCLLRRNLAIDDPTIAAQDRPGHVSVIVVPFPAADGSVVQPGQALLDAVGQDLDSRRLLTTRVHVVGPRYLTIGVQVTLVLKPGVAPDQFLFRVDPGFQADLDAGHVPAGLPQAFQDAGQPIASWSAATVATLEEDTAWLLTIPAGAQLPGLPHFRDLQTYTLRKEQGPAGEAWEPTLNVYRDVVRTQAIRALRLFFDPISQEPGGAGWPFGRNVYVSEIYQVLDTIEGVDYASPIRRSSDGQSEELDEIVADPARRQPADGGKLSAVMARLDELVDAQIRGTDILIERADT